MSRRWIVGGILAGTVIGLLALFGRPAYGRIAFGTLSAPPARIDYCSRRYYPSDPPRHLNLTEVQATLGRDEGRGPFQQIGVDAWGEQLFARVYDDATRQRFKNNLCTFEVFVRIRSDDYISYVLSGGP